MHLPIIRGNPFDHGAGRSCDECCAGLSTDPYESGSGQHVSVGLSNADWNAALYQIEMDSQTALWLEREKHQNGFTITSTTIPTIRTAGTSLTIR
jgi:hypothetical protein